MDNTYAASKEKWMQVAEDALKKMYEKFEEIFRENVEAPDFNREGYLATQFSLQQRTDSIGRIMEELAAEREMTLDDISLQINNIRGDFEHPDEPDFIDVSVVGKDGKSYANVEVDTHSEIVTVTKHDAIEPEVNHAIGDAVRDLGITNEDEKNNLAYIGKDYTTDRMPEPQSLEEGGYTKKEIEDMTPTKYKHDLAVDEAKAIKSEIRQLKKERLEIKIEGAKAESMDVLDRCKRRTDALTKRIEDLTDRYTDKKAEIHKNNLPHRMIHAGLNTMKNINDHTAFAVLSAKACGKEAFAKLDTALNTMDKGLCSFEYGMAKSQSERLMNKVSNLKKGYQKRRNRFANLKGVFTGKNEIKHVTAKNSRAQQARIDKLMEKVKKLDTIAESAKIEYEGIKKMELEKLNAARDSKEKVLGNTKTLDEKIAEVTGRTVDNNKKPKKEKEFEKSSEPKNLDEEIKKANKIAAGKTADNKEDKPKAKSRDEGMSRER